MLQTRNFLQLLKKHELKIATEKLEELLNDMDIQILNFITNNKIINFVPYF